jgi:hypothetical protein
MNDFAIDVFTKAIGRPPTDHELKWVGRWEPHAAVRLAGLNPAGEPDALTPICVPDLWTPEGATKSVSFYAELTTSVLVHNHGVVTGWRSLRYHDGNDALWPMRTATGELIRSDGGHLLQSPTFHATHMMVEPVTKCDWPKDTQNKGMWHLETFLRIPYQYMGKRVPKHIIVEAPAAVLKPAGSTREQELERRIAELEQRGSAKR